MTYFFFWINNTSVFFIAREYFAGVVVASKILRQNHVGPAKRSFFSVWFECWRLDLSLFFIFATNMI